jgi:hypothetical protein
MVDRVFGELSFKYGWKRKDEIFIFGKREEIVLTVMGNKEGDILDTQREAYLNFKNIEAKIAAEVEETIYKYYLNECDEYRDMLEDGADELAPIINNRKELSKLVKPQEMVILKKQDIRELGILFQCTWDIEAGVAVRIENEKIVEVGVQNIAL